MTHQPNTPASRTEAFTALIEALDRYMRQDETASDTDNGVYRNAKVAMSNALASRTEQAVPSVASEAVAGEIPSGRTEDRTLSDAERSMLNFLFSQMRDLSDTEWRQHGFRRATFDRLERKLSGAAPSAAIAAREQEASAYLMTRPSGFSWTLMPKDMTPAWREVCKADGVTITPLGPLTSRPEPPAVDAGEFTNAQLAAMVVAAGGNAWEEGATASMPGDFVCKLDADALRKLLASRPEAPPAAPSEAQNPKFTMQEWEAHARKHRWRFDLDAAADGAVTEAAPKHEGMTIAGSGASMLGALMREQRASRIGVYPDGNPNANRPEAPPASASPATVAQPVVWQYRVQPNWKSATGWSDWQECSAEVAQDYIRVPSLHDWNYQVRALYEAAQPCPSQGCGGDGDEVLPAMPDLRYHPEYRRGFANCLSEIQRMRACSTDNNNGHGGSKE